MSYIYHPALYAAECELAEYVKTMTKQSCQAIEPSYEGLKSIQPQAVYNACTQSFSVLDGMPGTGKTTTLGQIIKSYDNAGMTGIVICPTGQAQKRAAKTMREVTQKQCIRNKPECMTIHRGLEFDTQSGEFRYDFDNTLDVDYVVIDEGSMPDTMISRSAFAAINPKRTRVVMSGDPEQLPSVEPGAVMKDIIASLLVPRTYLTEILRQGPNSGIVWNAKRILEGKDLIKNDPKTDALFEDFFFVEKAVEETAASIIRYISEGIPDKMGFDPVKDIQCLCPGKKGVCGTFEMNKALRERLNPAKHGERNYLDFRLRDKIINRKNNLQQSIVNGDVGYVMDIGTSGMTVDFGEGAGRNDDGIVEIQGPLADHLYHAYASTVHSFQGCEVRSVVAPIHKMHYKLLYRNLLYTLTTRARELCCLLGDPKALLQSIRNNEVDRRVTGLQYWLAL